MWQVKYVYLYLDGIGVLATSFGSSFRHAIASKLSASGALLPDGPHGGSTVHLQISVIGSHSAFAMVPGAPPPTSDPFRRLWAWWSVCVCMCVSIGDVCRTCGWTMHYMRSISRTGRGKFRGLSGPFKSTGSLCCGICNNRDQSHAVNNGMQLNGSFSPQ